MHGRRRFRSRLHFALDALQSIHHLVERDGTLLFHLIEGAEGTKPLP